MIDRTLYQHYLFFKRHAGYTVGHRAQGALALAKAEHWLQQQLKSGTMSFTWEWDQDGDLGEHEEWCNEARCHAAGRFSDGSLRRTRREYCDHTIESCLIVDIDGDVMASLHNIIDPDNDYRRVVRAELALELYTNELACMRCMAL